MPRVRPKPAKFVDVWTGQNTAVFTNGGVRSWNIASPSSTSPSTGYPTWITTRMPRAGRIKSIWIMNHTNQLSGSEEAVLTVMKNNVPTPMTFTIRSAVIMGGTQVFRAFTGGPVDFEAGDQLYLRGEAGTLAADRTTSNTVVVEVEYT
jgi:hypothetical protein